AETPVVRARWSAQEDGSATPTGHRRPALSLARGLRTVTGPRAEGGDITGHVPCEQSMHPAVPLRAVVAHQEAYAPFGVSMTRGFLPWWRSIVRSLAFSRHASARVF